MEIKSTICLGEQEVTDFLNELQNRTPIKITNLIISITQSNEYFTIFYIDPQL